MSETNSQSIRSDRISESTIARIAGNLLSGVPQDWLQGDRPWVVGQAVEAARVIADQVFATRHVEPEGRTRWQVRTTFSAVPAGSKLQEITMILHDESGEIPCLAALPKDLQEAIQRDLEMAERLIHGRIEAWVLMGEKMIEDR